MNKLAIEMWPTVIVFVRQIFHIFYSLVFRIIVLLKYESLSDKSLSGWNCFSAQNGPSIFPIIRCNFKVPLEHIAPQIMTDPPPCLTVGTLQFALNLSLCLRRTNVRRLLPNNSNLDSSDHKTFNLCSVVQSKCYNAYCNLFLTFCFLRSVFCSNTATYFRRCQCSSNRWFANSFQFTLHPPAVEFIC
jgi:hypothetical protein